MLFSGTSVKTVWRKLWQFSWSNSGRRSGSPASYRLEVVDVEFQGGAKFRTLRVYIEKDAAERAKLAEAGRGWSR